VKRAFFFLILLLGYVSLIPWCIFWVGLHRVQGRPRLADPRAFDRASLVKAWESCGESPPLVVKRLSPSTVVAQIALGEPRPFRPGQRAAWRIASSHNLAHPVGSAWWHISGAALTIWITRNWSADEISAAVARDGLCDGQSKQSSSVTRRPTGSSQKSRYMCAWGTDCSEWDTSVDMANIEAHGYEEIPEDRFVMTTWHENEPLTDAFRFAKNDAHHPAVALHNTLLVHVAQVGREEELLASFTEA
jgi:hypothetical protein